MSGESVDVGMGIGRVWWSRVVGVEDEGKVGW